MSKIEKYNAAKRQSDQLRRDVTLATGQDSPRNDKHHLKARFSGMVNDKFTPMRIDIQASHGYYGSSSAYSNSSEALGRYLAAAITKELPRLAEVAVKMAEDEAEKRRLEAVEEANSVLETAK